MFMFAPMVEVRLPRNTSPLFTVRGPLDSEGNLDDSRLASEIKREMGFDGKVSLSWLSADELGVVTHNTQPVLTIRVE
jgi:hypothetical protein